MRCAVGTPAVLICTKVALTGLPPPARLPVPPPARPPPPPSFNAGALEMEGHVDRSIDPGVRQQLIQHGQGWRGINNPWMAEGEESEEFQYINLLVNPERYTGYKARARGWGCGGGGACFAAPSLLAGSCCVARRCCACRTLSVIPSHTPSHTPSLTLSSLTRTPIVTHAHAPRSLMRRASTRTASGRPSTTSLALPTASRAARSASSTACSAACTRPSPATSPQTTCWTRPRASGDRTWASSRRGSARQKCGEERGRAAGGGGGGGGGSGGRVASMLRWHTSRARLPARCPARRPACRVPINTPSTPPFNTALQHRRLTPPSNTAFKPSNSDRVQNLYFAYLFVLRAVMKAAPVLTTFQYDTGLAAEDAHTQQLVTQLVRAALCFCSFCTQLAGRFLLLGPATGIHLCCSRASPGPDVRDYRRLSAVCLLRITVCS